MKENHLKSLRHPNLLFYDSNIRIKKFNAKNTWSGLLVDKNKAYTPPHTHTHTHTHTHKHTNNNKTNKKAQQKQTNKNKTKPQQQQKH